MRNGTWTIRVSKRWVAIMAAAMLGASIATPVAVFAADRFTDVPNSNTFHADITWLADAGITKGCNPPANDEYCPDDPVTRAQMAAFMRRLANILVAKEEPDSVSKTMLQQSSVGSFEVLDGSLRPVDLKQEAGAASTSKVVKAPSTTFEPMATVEVAAPGRGYVFVTATGYAECSNGRFDYRLRSPELGEESFFNAVGFPSKIYQSWQTQYTFSVAAAGAASFVIEGVHTTGNCSDGGVSDLTAVYVPTAYGGFVGHGAGEAEQSFRP